VNIRYTTFKKIEQAFPNDSKASVNIFNEFQGEEQFNIKTIDSNFFIKEISRGIEEIEEILICVNNPTVIKDSDDETYYDIGLSFYCHSLDSVKEAKESLEDKIKLLKSYKKKYEGK